MGIGLNSAVQCKLTECNMHCDKHRKHKYTLWIPGQVVGDGIKEELSCLLPLIVNLVLVVGEQHTSCNVIAHGYD